MEAFEETAPSPKPVCSWESAFIRCLSAPDLCGHGQDTLGHSGKVIELMGDSLHKPVREHFGWAIGL